MTTRFVIVDQSLRNFDGHYFEYDLAVARAAVTLGLDTCVLAHRDFTSHEAFPVSVRPWFAHGWNQTHRSLPVRFVHAVLSRCPPSIREAVIPFGSLMLRHVGRRRRARPRALPGFGAELVAGLRLLGISASDHILVHTASIAELHALTVAFADVPEAPHVHIVLRRDADEPAVASDPWGGVSALLRRIRDTPALAANFHVFADTEALAAQHRDLAPGLPISRVPIPHCLSPRDTDVRDPGPLRIVYLGNARREKGFDTLPSIAAALRASHLETGRFQFVLQANTSLSLEEGVISAARKVLKSYPSHMVQLIDQALDLAGFEALLRRADIVILPYDADLYRRRSSGILVQAAILAKPLIVPANSWLAEEAPSKSSVQFSHPRTLAAAIVDCVDRFDALKEEAIKAAPGMARRHDAVSLVQTLMQSAGLAPDPRPPAPTQPSIAVLGKLST